MSRSIITINGQRIEVEGGASDIRVVGGSVSVGGNVVASKLSGDVYIRWEGPMASLTTDGSAEVMGGVQGDVKAGGSVECGDVGGKVVAGGSVRCARVGGNVTAGGAVTVR